MRLPLTAEVRGAGRRGPVHKSRDDERVQKFSADTPRAAALISTGGVRKSERSISRTSVLLSADVSCCQIIFFFSLLSAFFPVFGYHASSRTTAQKVLNKTQAGAPVLMECFTNP